MTRNKIKEWARIVMICASIVCFIVGMIFTLSGCSTHKKIAEHSILVDSNHVLAINTSTGSSQVARQTTIFDTSYLKHTIRTYAFDTVTKTIYLTKEVVNEASVSHNKAENKYSKKDSASIQVVDSNRVYSKEIDKRREVDRRPAIWVTALLVLSGVLLGMVFRWGWNKLNPLKQNSRASQEPGIFSSAQCTITIQTILEGE